MEQITVGQIKAGRCFKLCPYKQIYMIVTDEHNGNVQYHVVNIELGIVTCTYPNVARVIEFLNKWKAIEHVGKYEREGTC
jgi:hypothetical protein